MLSEQLAKTMNNFICTRWILVKLLQEVLDMFACKCNPISWLPHVWISYKTLRKNHGLWNSEQFNALLEPTRPGGGESRVQNEAMMPFSRLTSLNTSQNFVYFRNSGKSPQAPVKVSCTSNEVQAHWEGSTHFVPGTYFDLRWDPDLVTCSLWSSQY